MRGGSFGSMFGVKSLFRIGRINALAIIVASIVRVVLELCPNKSAMKP